MVHPVTMSDNECQRVKTSDSEWYNEWQQMTTSDEWYNEWQRVAAVVQQMKMTQYTSKNGWLLCFQWQKQIHYYFKGCLQLEWFNRLSLSSSKKVINK